MLVDVGDTKLDTTTIKPLTLRDFKNLKANGVDLFRNTNNVDEVYLGQICKYVLGKYVPAVTEDHVLDLPIAAVNKIVTTALGGTEEVVRPI